MRLFSGLGRSYIRDYNFIGLKIEHLLFSPGKAYVLEFCDVLLPAIFCKRSMPNDVSYTVMICIPILF